MNICDKDFNSVILVRMQSMMGFARLLESNIGIPEIPDSLFPIGMLDEILTVKSVINQVQDSVAKSIHKKYLEEAEKQRSKIGALPKPSEREWDDLPEIYRKSNRMAADHIDVKLRSIRCRRSDNPEAKTVKRSALKDKALDIISTLDDKTLENLAQMEHSRWTADRFSLGWKQGKRVDHAKVDHNLVPWEQLPEPSNKEEDAREYDRNSIKKIPEILDGVGQWVQKEVFIGVTGHRLNKITDNEVFREKIKKELIGKCGIKSRYPDAAFVVMSSLAEGSDQIVAEVAMEHLGARLVVPLPLPFELYIDSFGMDASGKIDEEKRDVSISEFTRLIGRAERYFELPLKSGSIADLGDPKDEAHKELRAKQYAFAGAFIVERCDELIAVWDGKPCSGPGGTAQIVQWRENEIIPEEFACPPQFFPQPEMKPSIIIKP